MRHDKAVMLAKVLGPLTLHYPQVGYTAAQLDALAEDWCEDLAAYPLSVLLDAVRAARRREKFFPCVAVLIGYADALVRQESGREAVRPLPTRAELEANAARGREWLVRWQAEQRTGQVEP